MSGTNNGGNNSMAPAGANPIGVNPLMPFSPAQVQANAAARRGIKQQGSRIRQLIQSGNFTVVPGQAFNWQMNPVPVGLVVGFILQVQCVINSSGGTGNIFGRSGFGPYNTVSAITYQNPSGFSPLQQVNGWALASVMAGRERKIPGAAFSTDSPTGFGSVIQPVSCPSILNTTVGSSTFNTSVEYEIPLAYAEKLGNFQGAVWAGTTLSSQSLQATFNPQFFRTDGDPYNSVFYNSGGTLDYLNSINVTWNLYQIYYDQFNPAFINGLIPDLSTSYYISQQPFASLAANANNQIPFINLRTFLSLTLAYDNGGSFNAGSDINNFQLVSSNQFPYWQKDIYQQSWETRRVINGDFPAGYYYFYFHDAPIATAAQGNTYLNFNPSSVESGAVLYASWEYLAVQQILQTAPAI